MHLKKIVWKSGHLEKKIMRSIKKEAVMSQKKYFENRLFERGSSENVIWKRKGIFQKRHWKEEVLQKYLKILVSGKSLP